MSRICWGVTFPSTPGIGRIPRSACNVDALVTAFGRQDNGIYAYLPNLNSCEKHSLSDHAYKMA